MEQWEIDLRARLEKDLPEGHYQIGPYDEKGLVLYTGKQGKIDYEVAFFRAAKNFRYSPGLKNQIDFVNPNAKPLTQKELEDFLSELSFKK